MGLEITTKDLGSRLEVRETEVTCEKRPSGDSIQGHTRIYKNIQKVYKNIQRVYKNIQEYTEGILENTGSIQRVYKVDHGSFLPRLRTW